MMKKRPIESVDDRFLLMHMAKPNNHRWVRAGAAGSLHERDCSDVREIKKKAAWPAPNLVVEIRRRRMMHRPSLQVRPQGRVAPSRSCFFQAAALTRRAVPPRTGTRDERIGRMVRLIGRAGQCAGKLAGSPIESPFETFSPSALRS